MNDLIYRQAAINVADATDYTGLSVEDVKKVTDEVVKGLKTIPSAEPDYDKIIAEIKQCISETREHGKYHAKFIQDNGELYIFGLETALSIIEDIKNEKANIS